MARRTGVKPAAKTASKTSLYVNEILQTTDSEGKNYSEDTSALHKLSTQKDRNIFEQKVSLVIWMNHPSHYQSDFFSELAKEKNIKLRVVYRCAVPEVRKRLGWAAKSGSGDLSHQEETLGQGWQALRIATIVSEECNSIHVINGIWSVPAFSFVAVCLSLLRVPYYFHAEVPNAMDERKGLPRLLKRLWARIIIPSSRGVLAIGSRACNYYEALDVTRRGVHWFAYFTKGHGGPKREQSRLEGIKIIYVGQFVKRKRVLELIETIPRLRRVGIPAKLILIGEGCQKREAQQLIEKENLTSHICILGSLEPAAVKREIDNATIGVLPSAFDGWGIVVNEYLQAGVPAVVSAGCGSADLFKILSHAGVVYDHKQPGALHDALYHLCTNLSKYKVQREVVEKVIGCRSMTLRFLKIVVPPSFQNIQEST